MKFNKNLIYAAKIVLKTGHGESMVEMGRIMDEEFVTKKSCRPKKFISDFHVYDNRLNELTKNCGYCTDCYTRMAEIIVTNSNKIKVV